MKTKIIIGMVVLSFLLIGCGEQQQEHNDEGLDIIVSIPPQKAFVKAVGGDLVDVAELIPPGGSPATYEPKPSDLALVEEADIYFRIGHIPFEKSHVQKFAELNQDIEIIDTSVNVKLRYFEEDEKHSHEHEEETENEHEKEHGEEEDEEIDNIKSIDPHIWLSPLQVKKQVDVIAKELSRKDPDNSDTYKNNSDSFKTKLDELHSDIEERLSELKTDKLMVFHPSWGYFADEYGLKQIAIERSGKEPTAKELQQIIQEARDEGIKVIFVQSQFNKDIAESVADEIGAIVVSIDPLSEDYIDNLKEISVSISESLNK